LIGLKCKIPNAELVGALFRRGLLTAPAGDNVVRFIPPLTIGTSEVDEAVGVLDAASEELSG
jgi:acetylornithine/N-succinyldiaminopimelate aminotransferase